MRPDIIDLNEFYGTRLGTAAHRVVRRAIRAMWPDVRDEALLGLGYCTPYLGLFRSEAERVFAVMPAAQGIMAWPRDGARLVTIAEEPELPLPDDAVDRILLVHAVEFSEQVRPLMREIWRVLRPGGRLLVVAPNRRGLWARVERTPFGQGHPFSGSQLSRLLRDNLFAPLRKETALYLPPSESPMLLRTAGLWQRLGRQLGRPFGGVVLVEASKQVYGAQPVRAGKRKRLFVPVPNGAVPAGLRPAHSDIIDC